MRKGSWPKRVWHSVEAVRSGADLRRDALNRIDRTDLIGLRKHQLVTLAASRSVTRRQKSQVRVRIRIMKLS